MRNEEEIFSIEEIAHKDEDGLLFEGFEIKTNRQSIRLLISAFQSCCESWGYFLSEDNLSEFIGEGLLGIDVTDTALKKYDNDKVDLEDGGDVMFVDLKTTIGNLQFVAYNSHNGHYGHPVKIKSEQLEYSITL